ncbi:MAG: RnfABCDGE type electron transport complex subunit D [Actinobacteria bacterium]|nr:MAG: RnfABCDGE type electron transport complex subunit D [Actinomycetota bacterium]
MDNFKFTVGPAPHIEKTEDTSKIMFWVIAALLPITIGAIYIMGTPALIVIAMSIAGSVGAEALWHAVSKKPMTIADGSAALTGLLLALTLPPQVSWWLPLFGGFIAITIAKFIFGGLGYNIFNPALVARAILLLSWPAQMTKAWLEPVNIDAKTMATPLYIAKKIPASFDAQAFIKSFLFTNKAGSIGEVSAVLLLVGAAILLFKKIIDWRIPFFYIGTVAFLTFAAGKNPTFYVLAGGLIIGAFFMATDYVTSPITPRGRIIYGVGLGAVTVLLRFYSNLSEGVMFAILFMNMLAPLIEKYSRPRVLGMAGKAKS